MLTISVRVVDVACKRKTRGVNIAGGGLRLLTRHFNMQRLNHQEIPTNEGRITRDSLFYIPRKLARQASRAEIASLSLSLSLSLG